MRENADAKVSESVKPVAERRGQTWLTTASDAEALARVSQFWDQAKQSIHAGTFWADEIKALHDEPRARFELAINNLPLPAAFREAAIAVRAVIRAKRKAKTDYSAELACLYWLAARASFGMPYSAKLQMPGFSVLQTIPGSVLSALAFDYKALGYECLELLNATDRKWFVESWGEPSSHSTLLNLHRSVWDEYESKYAATMPTLEESLENAGQLLEKLEAEEAAAARPSISTRAANWIKANW